MADLDREIAERVMGWHADDLRQCFVTEHDTDCPYTDWFPSTNIADAWLVVEKMRERGWLFGLNLQYAGRWAANFENKHDDIYFGYDDTAPLCGCRKVHVCRLPKGRWFVQCDKCDEHLFGPTKHAAIEAWNRRSIESGEGKDG